MIMFRLPRVLIALVSLSAIAGALAFHSASSTAAPAANTTVVCNGNTCGGNGATNFEYIVTPATGVSVGAVKVAISSPSVSLTGWQEPTGWSHSIVTSSFYQHDSSFVAHGSQATNNGNCGAYVEWSTTTNLQTAPFTLGFDVIAEGTTHEVEWQAANDTATFARNVGSGAGPVHGP